MYKREGIFNDSDVNLGFSVLDELVNNDDIMISATLPSKLGNCFSIEMRKASMIKEGEGPPKYEED